MGSKYTWKPDIPDQRDYSFAPVPGIALPPRVDLRPFYKRVYNQGRLGSCVSQSVSMAIDIARIKQGLSPVEPSRLFLYYNERDLEGTIDYDSGASIRDGIKTAYSQGYCPGSLWPYIISKFKIKPSQELYTLSLESRIKSYERLNSQNLNDLKGCLVSGYPFIFGFTVYESFESYEVSNTGIVPMPGNAEKVLGGHAVTCVGYTDILQSFIVRNSWGGDWGREGHFYIPYSYLTNINLSDDFWTIKLT